MSIPVTCPECQSHYHVGDEFAGRPGRCPECASVLHVPDPADEPETDEPARERHAFDDLPALSAGRRRDDVEYGYRPSPPPARPSEPRFDPHARAAKWDAVGRGLRNIMVAVVLMTVAELVVCAFTLVDGVQPGQQNMLGGKDKAMIIGNTLILVIAMFLWAAGRVGCGRAPYVPARRVALPAGVIAGLSAVCGACAFGGIVFGFLIAQNNIGAGAGLVMLGACAFIPTLIGFTVAEVMGLVSQVRMAKGLRDEAFVNAARLQLIVALVLTVVAFVGMCAFGLFLATEMEKAQQKQLPQQKPAPAEVQPAPKNKAAAGKKPVPNPGANGANGAQQEPPEFDLGEYPAVVYGITIGRALFYLVYAGVTILCVQTGRRAIREEIGRLVGDPHESDRRPYEYW